MRPSEGNETAVDDRRFTKMGRFAALVRDIRFSDSITIPFHVYRDLIDALYDMWLPIFGLGLVFVCICVLAAFQSGEITYVGLGVLGGFTTIWRVREMREYWRVSPVTEIESLKRWERRYARGSYTFAILLAALNVWALTVQNPLLHLITVSLAFSFAAGIVARISIRPKICITSLLLAAVPIVAALAAHPFNQHSDRLHTQMFVIEALLVAMITGLSLQTVKHLYRSTIEHHTVRHDLTLIAKYDALTGLANRILLRERFQFALAAAQRSRQSLALFFLDLDGFKSINDRYGHLAGDALLEQVAHRLEAIVRSNDTVARLGGDEFAVLQVGLHHEDEAKLLAGRIIRRLSERYDIDGVVMTVSVSIGVVIAPKQGLVLEQLLASADAALYRAKTSGKARAMFCTASTNPLATFELFAR